MLTRYLHVPKHTHTPEHRPKCTYMEIPVYIFFTHPTVYIEIKEIPRIMTTPTLYQESKEPKSAIQKLSLTFSKLYSLSLQQEQ